MFNPQDVLRKDHPGLGEARWAGWTTLDSEAESENLCLFPQSCFAVVLGGPQETGQLLEHRFDYIFYTGKVRGVAPPDL